MISLGAAPPHNLIHRVSMGLGWFPPLPVSLSAALPLSPHKYVNHCNQPCTSEEIFHTKSRQTGGISTVSSLSGSMEGKMDERKKNLIKEQRQSLQWHSCFILLMSEWQWRYEDISFQCKECVMALYWSALKISDFQSLIPPATL